MKNPHKALQAIERLVGGDFGLDMEWFMHDKRRYTQRELEDMCKQAARIIGEIYCISHAEVASCSHEEWKDIKDEILAIPEY